MTRSLPPPPPGAPDHVLVPVLPLRDLCLFPEASLTLEVATPASVRAVELASRAGRQVLALAVKDAGPALQALGTLGAIVHLETLRDGARKVELDGLSRARLVNQLGGDVMVAEAEPLEEGDPGDEWGAAVEALARYFRAHPELRSFLDTQRRSEDTMGWVNLACQHLPITGSARQKLLESPARDRCIRISRGLEALLRKEQAG